MAELAFLGLGTMGYPMAGHLACAGHQVHVWNRTRSVADRWAAEHDGTVSHTPLDAVANADIVFTCLGDDPDVREVAVPVLGRMTPGSIFIDHTTTSANLAKELFELASTNDILFMDAPVSGGQAGAENGQLTVMCGGNKKTFARAEPVMQIYSKAVRLMGDAGAGQLTKMVNQICIAGVVQGLAEGVHFAEQAGLDPVAVVGAIGKGAAQSWQMDNRHKTMANGEFNHGFAVDWMRKDLRIALEEAAANGALLPMTALVDRYYEDVQNMGGGRWDTSSLLERLRQMEEKARAISTSQKTGPTN